MTEKESANLKISRFSFSNAIFIGKIPLIASNLYQYLPAKQNATNLPLKPLIAIFNSSCNKSGV